MTNHHSVSTHEAVAAWKVAHRLVLDIYRLTNRLPAEEHYGLTPKIRTSAVKIASNIVEGHSRESADRYLGHLSESQAALEETKYSLLVARDLGYISEHTYAGVMRVAEDLGERLDQLQHGVHATAGPVLSAEAGRPAAGVGQHFQVKTGVRQSAKNFWNWLLGAEQQASGRIQGSKNDRVWTEDNRTTYLEGPEE